MGWVLWAAGKAGWYFYAWGPQLLICLYLGYLSARKTGGDRLDWLVAAFCASLIPIGGVIVMLAVWWRAGTASGGSAAAGAEVAAGGPARSGAEVTAHGPTRSGAEVTAHGPVVSAGGTDVAAGRPAAGAGGPPAPGSTRPEGADGRVAAGPDERGRGVLPGDPA